MRGMRIERLHVEGFGLHGDLRLALGPGLNVLLGANEAGKSTLHAFLRAMFHGLPRGAKFEPLRGGRHGGSLWLDVGEERVRVERLFSGRGKGVRVENSEGRELGQAHLAQLLGHVDQRVYRSVFAFDLEDLGERGLDAEEIEHRLFDAGLLGAGRSFADVAKRLKEQREAWLKPRSGPLRDLHRAIGAKEKELEEARRRAAGLAELLEQEDTLAAELRDARERRGKLLREQRRWALLESLWPDEVGRRELEEVVAKLPPAREGAGGSEAALLRVVAIGQRLRFLDEEGEKREREGQQLQTWLGGHPPAPELEGLGSALAVLLEERPLQQDRRKRMAGLEETARRERARGEALVASLGPEWTLERAQAVDVSVPRRERLDTLAEELRRAEGEVEQERARLRRQEERLELARGDESRARKLLDEHGAAVPFEALQARVVALAELQAALADRDRAAQSVAVEGMRPRRGSASGWWALSLAAGSFAAWAWASGLGAMAAALVTVGLAAAVGAWLTQRRAAGGGSGEGSPEDSLRRAAERVREHAVRLELPAEPTAGQVQAAAFDLDRQQRHRQRWEELHRQWQREALALARQAEEQETIARALEQEEERLRQVGEAWEREVADLGAGAHLGAEAAQVRMARIVDVRGALATAAEAEAGLRELRGQIEGWERRAEELLAAAGMGGPGAGSVEARLLALHERVAQARRLAEERDRVSRRLDGVRQALRELASEREILLEERASLLADAGVDGEEALRERVAQEREREQAEAALERLQRGLVEKIGEGDEAAALRAELATGDRARWAEALATCERELEELDEAISELDRRLALLRNERETLEASAAIPALAEEVEVLRTQWRAGLRAWRRAALLERLLGHALEELQERQQPVVLRSASSLFEAVTGGRYLRIRQVVDQRQVEVIDAGGRAVAASDLSRGTREQLYLCLRLGLVEAFAEQGIRLPLLMDDVLVNFDPVRAQATARVLGGVAAAQQILFFTCHPRTAQLLRDAVPGATMLALGDGSASEDDSMGIGDVSAEAR